MRTESRDRLGALVSQAQTGTALVAKADATLARAHALLHQPAPKPSVMLLQIPITCSRTGFTFLANGKRNETVLEITSTSSMPRGRRATAPCASKAGAFAAVEFAADFVCPGCRRPYSGRVWVCNCPALAGAVHSCGDEQRSGICACGQTTVMHFERTELAELRGTAAAARVSLASGSVQAKLPPTSGPTLLTGKR